MARQDWKAGNMLYPLPAVMISCKRPNEKPNIMTVAWVGTINSDPPMVSVSIRPERYSHDIIAETNEFVINITTEELAKATDYCGVKSGRDCNKFEDLHLTAEDSKNVGAPRIRESPIAIECKVTKVEKLGSHDMFLAKVVNVSVDERYMKGKGKFDMTACGLLAYSHGEYYSLGKKLGQFGFSIRSKKANRRIRHQQVTDQRNTYRSNTGDRETGNRYSGYTDARPNGIDAKPENIDTRSDSRNTKPDSRNTRSASKNTKPDSRKYKPDSRNTRSDSRNTRSDSKNTKPDSRKYKPDSRNTSPDSRNSEGSRTNGSNTKYKTQSHENTRTGNKKTNPSKKKDYGGNAGSHNARSRSNNKGKKR